MIVGRARELQALRSFLRETTRGSGKVALVMGEAGIGKTHLLLQIAAEAREGGFGVMLGRCFAEMGQRAFAPWREALGDAVLGQESFPRAPLGSYDERIRVFENVLTTLREHAVQSPTLVALEDLHWADRDSLLLFLHVSRFGLSGLGGAILLIATIRTPDLDGAQNETLDAVLAELARDPRCETISLRPFAEDEIAEAASVVAGGVAPQLLARTLLVETGGNPLYVRELTRHLLEEGKLAVREGRVAMGFAASELSLPQSIRHVVRQRAARLSKPTLRLLQCTSVAGSPVDLLTLSRAVDLDPDPALEAVDEAIACGMLRANGTRYELSHAIVRRALYEELNPNRRARLHRRLAEALACSTTADPAEIAAQYHASRELSGAEAGLPHAIAAGEAARAAGAPERAASFFALACDLIGPLGAAVRAEVTSQLAVARAEALESEPAIAAANQAFHLYGLLGNPTGGAEVLGAVARALELGGAPRSTWEPLVARGLSWLGDSRNLTWARLALLGRKPLPILEGPLWVSRFPGHDPAAVRLLREEGNEIDFAATVDPHDSRSTEDTAALLARVRDWREAPAMIRVLDTCARDVFFLGKDFHAAVQHMQALLELSERVGAWVGEVAARVVLSCSWAALGDFERSRNSLSHAREISSRLGSMHRMNVVGPWAAETVLGYFVGADFSLVAPRLLEFVASPRAGSTPFGFVALNLSLVGLSILEDSAGTERLLPFHLRALEQIPVETHEWGAGRDCGASAVWFLGLKEYAGRYLELALGSGEEVGCACWSSAQASAARMAALLGDLERARQLFDAARLDFEQTDRRPCLPICDYDEALAFVRCGHAGDPRVLELCLNAEQRFEQLGMAPWLTRVRQLRSSLTLPQPEQPDGLTQREVEVLRLLTQGLANKQIAAKLCISTPTVERHIANIYDKIGERGRAAATAYALRKKLVPD